MQPQRFISLEVSQIVANLRRGSDTEERVCRADVTEAVAEAIAEVLRTQDHSSATVKCLTAIDALWGYTRSLEER